MNRLTAALLLVPAIPLAPAQAQQGNGATPQNPQGIEAGACYGFAFGTWSPPLDWRAAGHAPIADSLKSAHPAGGRDWAAPNPESGSSVLLLYPSWWLAGVWVEFTSRAPAIGDTVAARATALVADGRVKSPTASARVWRVSCRT